MRMCKLLIGLAPVIVTEDNDVVFGRGGGAAAAAADDGIVIVSFVVVGEGDVVEECAAVDADADDTDAVGVGMMTPFFCASFSFLQNFFQ